MVKLSRPKSGPASTREGQTGSSPTAPDARDLPTQDGVRGGTGGETSAAEAKGRTVLSPAHPERKRPQLSIALPDDTASPRSCPFEETPEDADVRRGPRAGALLLSVRSPGAGLASARLGVEPRIPPTASEGLRVEAPVTHDAGLSLLPVLSEPVGDFDWAQSLERRGALGTGAFGRVEAFIGRDESVAIKTIDLAKLVHRSELGYLLSWSRDAEPHDAQARTLLDALASRVRREIETLARLPPHVNLIRFLGARQVENNLHIAMEHVPGTPLESLPPEAIDVVRMVRELAEGLAACHRAGIMHRDIKPSNALETSNGVKVIDFGEAAFLDQPVSPGRSPVTYKAPEMILGDPSERGAAADVYALGKLAEWLMRRKAKGAAAEHAVEVMHLPILTRMIAENASDRPTMQEVACALRPPE